MELFFKYFYSIGVLFGLVNTTIIRKRIAKMESDMNISDDYALRFKKNIIFAFTLPFALLQIIQLLGGFNNPFYVFYNDFSNVFYILGISVLIISWILLLYWVLIGNGSKILSVYHKAFNIPDNEILIKAFFILTTTAGAVAVFVISRYIDFRSSFQFNY